MCGGYEYDRLKEFSIYRKKIVCIYFLIYKICCSETYWFATHRCERWCDQQCKLRLQNSSFWQSAWICKESSAWRKSHIGHALIWPALVNPVWPPNILSENWYATVTDIYISIFYCEFYKVMTRVCSLILRPNTIILDSEIVGCSICISK